MPVVVALLAFVSTSALTPEPLGPSNIAVVGLVASVFASAASWASEGEG